MSALEQEILDGLKHLSEQAKLSLLGIIKSQRAAPDMGFDQVYLPEISLREWLDAAEQVRLLVSVDAIGSSVSDLLNELREERIDDLIHGH